MRIVFLIGQSCSGKDTILKKLLERNKSLKKYITNTTRAKRPNEIDGIDYNFSTDDDYFKALKDNKVIESRDYILRDKVVHYYSYDCGKQDGVFISVGTPTQCKSYIDYYGEDTVTPILIKVSEYNRLLWGIKRTKETTQDYYELCRRFLDEFKEYTIETINSIPNLYIVENNNLKHCIEDIETIIKEL